MKITLGLAVVLLAVVLLAAAPAAESPAPQPPAADSRTIDKLITDLGSQSFDVRESAQKRLIEIGEPAQPPLHAATKSDDPEVRARAAAALKAIRTRETCIKDLGAIQVEIKDFHPNISPSGERLAYMQGDQRSLVCDGKQGPAWDRIEYVGRFSTDGRRFGYQAVRGDQAFVVFVGDEDHPIAKGEARVGWLSPLARYSPDGTRVAFSVAGAGGERLVCDGKEGPPYKRINGIDFSPDSKRMAYSAMDDKGNGFMVLDGVPLGPYQERIGSAIFSPDSKRVAYTVLREAKAAVICDGKEGKAYDTVHYPIFSPDSKDLAYWTRSADLKTFLVVWNENVVGRMTGEPQLTFSPDSRRLAWATWHSGGVYLCEKTATQVTSGYDNYGRVVFSPDSKHIAYAAGKDMKWGVCVNDQALRGRYDPQNVRNWDGPNGGGTRLMLTDQPGFSADGRHVFFKGFRGPPGDVGREVRRQFIVCDGVELPEHDGVWIPGDFQNHAKRLRYVVRDGAGIRLVEVPWPEPLSWQDAVEPAKR